MVLFKVQNQKTTEYQPVKAKGARETKNVFIKKVRKESLVRQQVEVDNFQVTFGVEGPIIFGMNKIRMVSAEVKNGRWGKHYILFSPDLKTLITSRQTFLRLDSGCLSGVVFGDKTCDCLQQLRKAQEIISKNGGIIIHIPEHDGRGWGEFKMSNQRIMDECCLDTISSALAFYKDESIIDQRDFREAALVLKALGFPGGYKFNLGTKNSKKERALIEADFMVSSGPVEPRGLNGKQRMNLKAKYDYWQVNQKGTK